MRRWREYRQYLEDVHTAFQGVDAIGLESCAFLHNAQRSKGAALLDERYRRAIGRAPLYFGGDVDDLVDFLVHRVRDGDEGELLSRVTEGRYRPSRSLMNHVADMIEGSPVYTLLDEQLVVTNSVLRRVQRAYHERGKAVVLVKGGPGTGKSVIAAHLVARLNRLGYATQHATGSKAFTENLRKAVGRRAGATFKYFNNYTHVDEDDLDVLVCDEAHRIRSTSNHRFTRKDRRSTRTQIEELVRASRVSVFLLDDLQVVRPGEVGSSTLIRDEAAPRRRRTRRVRPRGPIPLPGVGGLRQLDRQHPRHPPHPRSDLGRQPTHGLPGRPVRRGTREPHPR